jgi:hypothetical protein
MELWFHPNSPAKRPSNKESRDSFPIPLSVSAFKFTSESEINAEVARAIAEANPEIATAVNRPTIFTETRGFANLTLDLLLSWLGHHFLLILNFKDRSSP